MCSYFFAVFLDATTKVQLPELSLKYFIPRNRSYIRYLGSLTTPPCSEEVVWTLMSTPLAVHPEQLNALRRLRATKEAGAHKILKSTLPINNNFRPLQLLNGRNVNYFHDGGGLSDSSS
jgi:carbonic anhydrase